MDAEQVVKKFLAGYGLEARKFDKSELKNGKKSPDYRVYDKNKLLMYCEVKNPEEDIWPDTNLELKAPVQILGGLRKDPIFNRLSTHIHKARKQFDAVNKDENLPNVLTFYNEDEKSDILDLLAVTTGNFYAAGGDVLPIYKNISEGRIKSDIEKIHLVIWIDAFKPNRFLFNVINSKHLNALCKKFGFDPNNLKLVRR